MQLDSKSPRCLLLIVSLWIDFTAAGYANEPSAFNDKNCFERLEQATLIDDSVTIITANDSTICGVRPIVSTTSSILLMRQTNDFGIKNNVSVPFENIRTITYRTHGRAKGLCTLLGLSAGAVAGFAVVGGRAAETDRDWDCDVIGAAFAGGMVGGLIGAIAGNAIGKRITFTVRLDCLDPP